MAIVRQTQKNVNANGKQIDHSVSMGQSKSWLELFIFLTSCSNNTPEVNIMLSMQSPDCAASRKINKSINF